MKDPVAKGSDEGQLRQPRGLNASKLAAMTRDQLLGLARHASGSTDPILAGRIIEAVNGRRLRTSRLILDALHPGLGLTPVPWLSAAQDAAKQVAKTTSGIHHLYVILLDGFSKDGRYGAYVGESRYRPERRFRQHKDGLRASGAARRMGICLLPSLYEHLNPLPRDEAKRLEFVLAEAFRGVGVPVRGGH